MSAQEAVDLKTKRFLLNLCSEFLGDVWNELGENDIECKTMSMGFANNTYYCSIAGCQIPAKYGLVNNKQVIIHIHGSGIFGEKNALKFNGEAAEAVIVHILSEMGLHPKLLGVFPGGRIEEYIPSKIASPDDLRSIDLSKAVVRKLAQIHALKLPISKSPNLFEKMGSVMQGVGEVSLDDLKDKYNQEDLLKIQNIFNFDLKNEIAWVASIVPKISHRVICSHNDMNSNNILLKNDYTSMDDRVVIIDYEMCRYFFRGYDFAYFLRMRKSRLRREENGTVSLMEEDIDETRNDELLKEYLKTFSNITKLFDPKYDTVEHFKMEIALFDLLYDCMVIGYARVALKNAQISIDYIDSLAANYSAKKIRIQKEYGDVFEIGG